MVAALKTGVGCGFHPTISVPALLAFNDCHACYSGTCANIAQIRHIRDEGSIHQASYISACCVPGTCMMAVAAVTAGGTACLGCCLAVLIAPVCRAVAVVAVHVAITVAVAIAVTVLMGMIMPIAMIVIMVVAVAVADVRIQHQQIEQVHRDARHSEDEHHCGTQHSQRRGCRSVNQLHCIAKRKAPLSNT